MGPTWASPARTGRSARLRPSLWGIPDVSEQGEFSPLSVKNGQKELSGRTSEPRGKEVSGPRAARLAAQRVDVRLEPLQRHGDARARVVRERGHVAQPRGRRCGGDLGVGEGA